MSSVFARVWATRPATPTPMTRHSTHGTTVRVRAFRETRAACIVLNSSAAEFTCLCVLCTMRCAGGGGWGYHEAYKLCDDSRREVTDDNPERARCCLPDRGFRVSDPCGSRAGGTSRYAGAGRGPCWTSGWRASGWSRRRTNWRDAHAGETRRARVGLAGQGLHQPGDAAAVLQQGQGTAVPGQADHQLHDVQLQPRAVLRTAQALRLHLVRDAAQHDVVRRGAADAADLSWRRWRGADDPDLRRAGIDDPEGHGPRRDRRHRPDGGRRAR